MNKITQSLLLVCGLTAALPLTAQIYENDFSTALELTERNRGSNIVSEGLSSGVLRMETSNNFSTNATQGYINWTQGGGAVAPLVISNGFESFEVRADFRVVNERGGLAMYLATTDITGPQADPVIWGMSGTQFGQHRIATGTVLQTAGTNTSGTPLGGTKLNAGNVSAAFDVGTWYSFSLQVQSNLDGNGDKESLTLVMSQFAQGDFDGTAITTVASTVDLSTNGLDDFATKDYRIGLGLFGDRAGGTNAVVEFDNLSVIPEPRTYAALIGLAALGFVALRRRR